MTTWARPGARPSRATAASSRRRTASGSMPPRPSRSGGWPQLRTPRRLPVLRSPAGSSGAPRAGAGPLPLPWCALMALPLAFILPAGGSEPHVVGVRASMLPSAGAVDCNRPTSFFLDGVIETDAKADVVYHWEAPGWRGPSRQLAFDEAGAQRLPSERHDAASIPAERIRARRRAAGGRPRRGRARVAMPQRPERVDRLTGWWSRAVRVGCPTPPAVPAARGSAQ